MRVREILASMRKARRKRDDGGYTIARGERWFKLSVNPNAVGMRRKREERENGRKRGRE